MNDMNKMTEKEIDEACSEYYKEGGMKPCGSDYTNEQTECVAIPDDLDIRFFKCNVCGQIVAVIGPDGNPLTCCMRDMQLLEPGVTDGVKEKHVPVFCRKGHKVIVTVGEEEHPMTPEHHIEWICLVTCKGIQWKHVADCEHPTACFRIGRHENVAAVYAYCNLHGLWKCC